MIYGALILPDGTVARYDVLCDIAAENQADLGCFRPRVGYADDRWLVTWETTRDPLDLAANPRLVGRLVERNGDPVTKACGAPLPGANSWVCELDGMRLSNAAVYEPSITHAPTGGFMIAMTYAIPSTQDSHLYAVHLDRDGGWVDSDFIAQGYDAFGDQPSIAYAHDTFWVAFRDPIHDAIGLWWFQADDPFLRDPSAHPWQLVDLTNSIVPPQQKPCPRYRPDVAASEVSWTPLVTWRNHESCPIPGLNHRA